MSDRVTINGPINCVRLEGDINGVKKILYLFFDVHLELSYQNRCTDFTSDDFLTYLAKTFKNIDSDNKNKNIYDFFFENTMTGIKNTNQFQVNTYYRQRYIDDVSNYFRRQLLKSHPTLKKEKSNHETKIRFHYLDIRDYPEFLKVDEINNKLMNLVNSINNDQGFYANDFLSLHSICDEYINIMNFFYDLFNKKNKTETATRKLIKKITESYKHKNVKEKLEHHIKNIKDLCKTIIILLQKFISFIDSINVPDTDEDSLLLNHLNVTNIGEKKFVWYGANRKRMENINEILIKAKEISYAKITVCALITDLFFLRRFLDKEYINHAISYTGARHSTTYIFALVKYFRFEITHCSYVKNNDINEAMRIIRLSEYDGADVELLFHSKLVEQCSDITNFPKNFE